MSSQGPRGVGGKQSNYESLIKQGQKTQYAGGGAAGQGQQADGTPGKPPVAGQPAQYAGSTGAVALNSQAEGAQGAEGAQAQKAGAPTWLKTGAAPQRAQVQAVQEVGESQGTRVPAPFAATGQLLIIKGRGWVDNKNESDRWFMKPPNVELSDADSAEIKQVAATQGADAAAALLRQKVDGPGHKVLELVASPRNTGPTTTGISFLQAFAGLGDMTLRGQIIPGKDILDKEGKKIGDEPAKLAVEDYTPGTSNEYVYGRLDENAAAQGKWIVNTPRGPVHVTDEAMGKKLIPKMTVILPGDPVMKDGKLVYEHNRPFWGLGRANMNQDDQTTGARTLEDVTRQLEALRARMKESPPANEDEGKQLQASLKSLELQQRVLTENPDLRVLQSTEFGFSKFTRGPTFIPKEATSLITHNHRGWYLIDDVGVGEDGKATHIVTRATAGDTEGFYMPSGPQTDTEPGLVNDVNDKVWASRLGTEYGFVQQSKPPRLGYDGFVFQNDGPEVAPSRTPVGRETPGIIPQQRPGRPAGGPPAQ
jgi:hypothetical protein